MLTESQRILATTELKKAAYAGKTPAEMLAMLNARTLNGERPTLRAATIFEAIDLAEYASLSAATKANIGIVLNLAGDDIPVTTGSKARAILTGAFPANGATMTALGAAVLIKVSLAEQFLGRFIEESEITQALFTDNGTPR